MLVTRDEIAHLENSLLWQSRFSRFVVNCSRIFRKYVELDVTQVRIMMLVAHFPKRTVGFYCETLSLRPSTVSMALRSLDALGYVCRVVSDTDARSIRVDLTEEGYAVFPRMFPAFQEIDGLMDRDLKAGSLESICDMMHKDGLRDFLVKIVNFEFVDDAEAYKSIRINPEDDPQRNFMDTALYVESAANLISLLGRNWMGSDLNLRTGRILSYVFIREEQGATEVGVSVIRDALIMQPAEVSAGVMKLEEDGLIIRMRGETDRRLTMVSLTSKGRNVAMLASKSNLDTLDKSCEGLSAVNPLLFYQK